ncbi:hypothetical protein ACFVRB_27240 [Streptomyces nojiriensis]|uniref:hypothetical protein n=1 Tax=Streptomyces nojiriensis TaxID=66374 RepID=UPI0036D9A25E
MFEAPAPATVDRMLAAQRHAADQFGLRATGRRVWGYRGRTLSGAAGPHWLRVVCAEAGTEGGTLWDGPSTSRTLPVSVPRPDLFRIRDWTTGAYAYRAELYALAPTRWSPRAPSSTRTRACPRRGGRRCWRLWTPSPTCHRWRTARPYARSTCAASASSSPATSSTTSPGPPPTATSTTATSPAARTSWTGKDGAAPRTATTRPPCTCTPCWPPEAAVRIRTELAPVLDRPEARTGLLTVCAQVLQGQDRVDFYAELSGPVREHLAHL